MDKDWFDRRIVERGTSMRQLANHLGIDVSAVSRMFDGKRQMKPREAPMIARFLDVSVEEVIKRADRPDLAKALRHFEIEAEVGLNGAVKQLKTPREFPAALVAEAERALEGRTGPIGVAQIRTNKGGLAQLDDALLVYEKVDYVQPEAVGTLSIMRLRDGVTTIGRLQSHRKTGEAVIRTDEGERQVEIVSAAPVKVLT